ncbi:hypothetical protein PG985_003755 [Apiospora marii]|uniref:Uncharacterized protein n=1 Tax=Apiospora marii TaxID=335849 RepID=A0ABR1SHB3_9PEZI
MALNTFHSRYDVCRTLHLPGIPCVVWGQDALVNYGSNGALGSLHLLVSSVDEAADVLVHLGWRSIDTLHDDQTGDGTYCSSMPTTSVRRLFPPDAPSVYEVTPQPKLVLQAAAYWQVPLQVLAQDGFIPPLATLVDSLIKALLDTPDGTHLHLTLKRYVKDLYSPAI